MYRVYLHLENGVTPLTHKHTLGRINERLSHGAVTALLARFVSKKTPIIMGVLNLTPDSFSDGGEFLEIGAALKQAARFVAEGVDIVDIGGESTRPSTFRSGAPLDEEEEMRRVLPVIEALAKRYPSLPLSIDTYKAATAKAALEQGAVMVNDVSAMRADVGMCEVVRAADAFICLMHMPGLPTLIPPTPTYRNVSAEVSQHLVERAQFAEKHGIASSRICIDPGIGFGKSVQENLQLIKGLRSFTALPYPVLVGPSRKSFIGAVLGGLPADKRLEGTLAAVTLCVAKNAAILRVHDVGAARRAALMAAAVRDAMLTTDTYSSD